MSAEEAGVEEEEGFEEEEEATEEGLELSEEVEEEKEKKIVLKKKKEEEEEIVEERIYTVPLGRAWIVPRNKRSPKVMRLLRSFIVRHMKADEGSIRIKNEVNEKIWSRGIKKPPRKVRIRATKDTEGIVTVHLAQGD